MIARKNRFHGRGSLNYTYSKGKVVRSGSLALKFVRARQEDYRLAVVVSKKVSKSAVVRNRIRRRVYEAVRTMQAEKDSPLSYDMILSVFDESIASSPATELKKQVQTLFKRAGLH